MSSTPGRLAPARRSRSRRQRLTRTIVLALAVLLLVLSGVATWLFGFSSVFATTQVVVSGTSLLSEDEVVGAARVELGRPLAVQDLQGIRSRVAESLPAVREVEVKRRFPHTVEILVTERELSYLWTDDGVLRWVDAEGVVYHEGGDVPAGTVAAQVQGEVDQRLLRDVATVVGAATPVLGERVTLVSAQAVDQIEIRLDDGDSVVWGSADQSDMKAQVLAVLLSVDATVYDVSAPGAPTTR
ncbi:cell division protein FtsQ/DivIB [Arachnia propionica]|uniref:cell division protein FtsQ/DivIB n=1 Tax=Arachnia propionica TaxID=1750 RepID=UPI00163A2739|nr:FtsQ-type POTRA domain-containing protein [Arachnia propionica]MDO5083501.1 FtsQ-type POTRA domain-containing protein [Arachnia propionica]